MVRRLPLLAAAALTVVLAGCGLKEDRGDLVAGKQAFVEGCGGCHVLARAGTAGVSGPNLDEAFRAAREEGMGESTIEGVVHDQILYPARTSQIDPASGAETPGMPAKIVTGDAAKDVAAYVAFVAAKGGEDEGPLAKVGVPEAGGTAEAENGTLEIPATGATAFAVKDATAPAGALTIRSENQTPVPHNIAVEGAGVDEAGPVVQQDGVSEVQADLQAGEYTFYCSVPGHREGGMEGTLTVE